MSKHINHDKRMAVLEHQLRGAKQSVKECHRLHHHAGVKFNSAKVKRLHRELKALKKASKS